MRKIFLVSFLFSVLVFGLFSQNADFFELPFNYDQSLYPDYQYFINPAIAQQLKRSIDKYYGSFGVERDSTKAERTTDTTGVTGGIDTWTQITFEPYVSYFRFNKNTDYVTVFGGSVYPQIRDTKTKTVDYNSDGEDIKTNRWNFESEFSGGYLRAWNQGDFSLGFFGGLGGPGANEIPGTFWDPAGEEFTWTTDKALNGGDPYIAGASGSLSKTSEFVVKPLVNGGIVKNTDGTWYGLGLNTYFIIDDKSRKLTAVDTDGDGFNDDIVTEEEYQTNTDWGLGNAYYDYKYQTQMYYAAVYPAMIKPLSNNKDLILSGRLDLIDLYREVSYTRTASDDESKSERLIGSYCTSGSFLAGFRQSTDFGAEFRYGVYTNFDMSFVKDNNYNAAGDDTYDSRNTDHYAEIDSTTFLNWGGDDEPDNGGVKNYGSNPFSIDTDIGGIAGLQWRISPNVVLFGTGSAAVNFNYEKYALFDTATGKVWTEWVMKNTLAFNVSGNFGLQFQLPGGPFITISGDRKNLLLGSAGDNYINFDPLPEDSDNITSDKNVSNGEGFSVTVQVTVRR